MRIDNKLNLVIEVSAENGSSFFIHSMPVSFDVFEKYAIIIGKTFSTMIAEGLNFVSGPRVAAIILKKLAKERNEWDGTDGVASGLLAEIRRLSNVLMPSDKGWQTIPFQDAIDKQIMPQEDIAEVEGLLVFFTVVSLMTRKAEKTAILERMKLWGSQITSLNCMAFADSLKTLTAQETSAQTGNISSVPS
jgi:hypothetical protein